MFIVHAVIEGVIPVYINVTDLNEFFHAGEDESIFYYPEADSCSAGSCDKRDLVITSIQFPIK